MKAKNTKETKDPKYTEAQAEGMMVIGEKRIISAILFNDRPSLATNSLTWLCFFFGLDSTKLVKFIQKNATRNVKK